MICIDHLRIWKAFGPRDRSAKVGLLAGGLFVATIVAGFVAASLAQSSADGRQDAIPLVPGVEVERSLTPHEKITVAFPLHAGQYTELHVEQIHGMARETIVTPDGKRSPPYFNDGGAGSIDDIPFIASQDGTVAVQIESRERHAPIAVMVSRDPERAPAQRDIDFLKGSDALARAEYIRLRSGSHPLTAGETPQKVLALYDEALRWANKTASGALARKSLTGKARYELFRSAQYQQGLKTARKATELPASIGDTGQQALAWKTLASAYGFTDRYQESIDASKHALALYRKTGDLYWQGIVLGNLADIYQETGESTKAIQAAQQALELARQTYDDYGVAFTRTTIGEIYQERGEYQMALNAYGAAQKTANLLNYPQVEGELWSDLGSTYTELADWQRAKAAYEHALPILQKDRDAINEIEVLGDLGQIALHYNQPVQAQSFFREGLVRARQQQLLREETFLEVGLAQTCMAAACRQDPVSMLQQAGNDARQIDQLDGEASVETALGEILQARHDTRGAMKAYQKAAAFWRQIPNASEVAKAHAGMARLHAQMGQLHTAHLEIQEALNAIENSRAHIDSDRLRTSYFTSHHSYYDLAVDILMQLHTRYPNRGYAEQAWQVAERARARTLLDQLERENIAMSRPAQRLRLQSAALEVKIHQVQQTLLRSGSSRKDIAQAQQLQVKLRSMLLQADQLQDRIRATNPAYQRLVENRATPSTMFRTGALDAHTALVEYWLGPRASYAWIITKTGLRSFPLPGQSCIDTRVHAFQEVMLARERYIPGENIDAYQRRIQSADRQLSRQSQELAAILLPVTFKPEIQRLVIVADGSLQSFPFAALELPHSHTRGPNYLIRHYDLVYEPSALTIATLLTQYRPASGRQRIAIFADPVYSMTDARIEHRAPSHAGATAPAWHTFFPELDSELPRLLGSRQEALRIAQLAGASRTSLFLGFSATPTQVENTDWTSYTVAHFAAHAIVNTAQPEFSGVVLSLIDRTGAPVDGVLWIHDIYRLHIPVSLVVLSGCETADGKPIPGEGINGLARAFLYADSQAVIGTLWNADDASSDELMQRFYRSLFDEHMGSAAALRQAQLQTLSKPAETSPYYWAGFILEGNWNGR